MKFIELIIVKCQLMSRINNLLKWFEYEISSDSDYLNSYVQFNFRAQLSVKKVLELMIMISI